MAQLPTTWSAETGTFDRWASHARGGGLRNLMQWGPVIQFQVQPLNFNEMDHETATDWAHKEIAGAAIYREWVGENDELIYLRGKLYPYRIGGFSEIEAFDAYRRAGISQQLIRGDGVALGWYVCDKLVRNHTYISFEGLGQQVGFEAVMARTPVPNPNSFLSQLYQAAAPGVNSQ